MCPFLPATKTHTPSHRTRRRDVLCAAELADGPDTRASTMKRSKSCARGSVKLDDLTVRKAVLAVEIMSGTVE
jgi:hypothetical protein